MRSNEKKLRKMLGRFKKTSYLCNVLWGLGPKYARGGVSR